MDNWLQKYKPTNISDVIVDTSITTSIDSFIKQFTKNSDASTINRPSIIITGPNGVGKTLLVDLILQKYNIEKMAINLTNIKMQRENKKKEDNGSKYTIKSYYMSFNNKRLLGDGKCIERKIALVIDDISNICSKKEKDAIKSIVKLNNKYKKIPIIIISNNKHSKLLNVLRKMVTYSKDSKKGEKILNELNISPPNFSDLESFIKKIANKEKMQFITKKTDDSNLFMEIINHSQYDIRRLVNILEELNILFDNSSITLEKFQHFVETSKLKDIDPGIYEATRLLLNDYSGIETCLSLYCEERSTIPLMVHKNYPMNINTQYPKMNSEEKIDLICNISSSISKSDKIDGLIYSHQCWNLQPIHGFYSCVIPSFLINEKPNKLCKMERCKYTLDYNKTSIKKINNKIIKKTQENNSMKKIQNYDFLYISNILRNLLQNKDFNKIAELMKPYKLKVKDIESIIKIDKINKTRINFTGKQKNQLKELLESD
jgi:hypothetical protein